MSIPFLFLRKVFLYLLLVLVFFASPFLNKNAFSWSAKGSHNIYVGANVGTMGIQGYGAYYYKNFIGLKIEGGGMPKIVTGKISNALEKIVDDLSLQMNMWNYGIAFSIRPFGGSWYIDAGLRKINYSGDISLKRDLYGAYNGIAEISGNTTFIVAKGVRPYLETGWNFNVVAGLNIDFSVGVIYTGKWKADYPIVEVFYNEESYSEEIDSMVEEEVYDIFKTVDDFNKGIPSFLRFWPIVKIGLSYRFDI